MYRKEFNEPNLKEMKNQLLKGVCPPQSITEKLLTRLSLHHNEQSVSREDEKFLAKIEKEIVLVNGHYELPLPFRMTMWKCLIIVSKLSKERVG